MLHGFTSHAFQYPDARSKIKELIKSIAVFNRTGFVNIKEVSAKSTNKECMEYHTPYF